MNRFVIGALAAACLTACAPQQVTSTEENLVERGEYLVLAVAGCNDCHTPMTQQGPDMARSLQGGTLIFAPTIQMPWAPVAPPLAGLPEHFSEEQFARFLQTGERRDGTHALPPMPAYRMSEADALAVTAYVKSLPRAHPE